MPKRLMIAALAALAASLVFASVSNAAVTFGSRLIDNPSGSMCNNMTGDPGTIGGPCTMVMFQVPTAPNGDLSSQGAPISGVITKFRIKALGEMGTGTATATLRLANVTANPNDPSAIATAAGTGPTVQIPEDTGGDAPITVVGARLPVTAGQHLAVDGSANLSALHVSDGGKWTYVYGPPLVDGQGGRDSTFATEELLAQVDIEPDADHDGFGDETQDACPTQATTQGPCDHAAPAVSDLKISGGSKISYTLSEAASVKFALAKASTGRKVNGKCVRKTRRNARKPHCTRFSTLGAGWDGPGAVGINTVSIPKIHGRKLGAGRYKITMTVKDAAGNTATTTKTFTIKPKPKKKHHHH
jgi:hypothetical protein